MSDRRLFYLKIFFAYLLATMPFAWQLVAMAKAPLLDALLLAIFSPFRLLAAALQGSRGGELTFLFLFAVVFCVALGIVFGLTHAIVRINARGRSKEGQ